MLPGTYYLNKRAYEAALVDTRIQTWQYQGGYIKRRINLTLNQNGQIEQTAEIDMELEIYNINAFNRALAKLSQLNDVISAKRL